MRALVKLSFRIFGQNRKRNLFNVLSLSIAMFFISSLLLLYRNYEAAQIENAYAYAGTWDYCIPQSDLKMQQSASGLSDVKKIYLINYSLTAKLDPIADTERSGPSAELTDHWLMSLVEIEEGASEVLSDGLAEGRWPVLDNEIAVPWDFVYSGKKLLSKEYQIGDTIELSVGRRLLPGSVPTQEEQLSGMETFEPLGVRTFCITGVIEGEARKSGNYVSTAYIGNPDRHHDHAVLYICSAPEDSRHFEMLKTDLAEELGIPSEQIEKNDAVVLAMRLIETSNISKQYRTAGIVLILCLLALVCTIVLISQSLNFQASQREFSIMMVNGCSRGLVSSILWLQNVFVCLLAMIVSTTLDATVIQVFSKLIAELLAEQGERFSGFTAVLYGRDVFYTFLMVFVLISILPWLFTARIDFRNLGSCISGQSLYNQSVIRAKDTNVPVWIRTYARKKAAFITLSLSILISVLVLSLGFAAARTIRLRSQTEITQYAADFYVVKSLMGGEEARGETEIMAGLPPHTSAYYYLGAGAQFNMPNDKLTEELRAYYRNTDQAIRTSTSIFALNEEMFNLVKGDELISYEEFSEKNIAIFYNQAFLTKEYSASENANAGSDGAVELSDNAPYYKNRIIDMSIYEKGDHILLNTVSGTQKSYDLELAGTSRNYFGELFDDLPEGGIYISYKTFYEILGDSPCYEIMLISCAGYQHNDVADYLQTAGSLFNYYVQDHSELTKTARIGGSIQLIFIYALMGLAAVTSLINTLSIWGFEAFQQRRMMTIRRAFGQSYFQGVLYSLLSKLYILMIASALFVILISPLISFGLEIFEYYGITMKSAGVGLVIAFALHAMVLVSISLIESGRNNRIRIADDL